MQKNDYNNVATNKKVLFLLFSFIVTLCLFLVPTLSSLLLVSIIFCGLLVAVFFDRIHVFTPSKAQTNSIISIILTVIIQLAGIARFIKTWSPSSKVTALATSLNLPVFVFLAFISLVCAIIGFYASYIILSNIVFEFKHSFNIFIDKNKNSLRFFSRLKKIFVILFIMYMLAVSALIMSDVSYIDDMGRVAYGYTEWEYFSRYTSKLLSHLIHTDLYLADISPLPQIIAVIFITASSLIALIVFSDNSNISFWNIIAVMPIGISPYFLECLSYKYDSTYMAISVFASVFPLLFRKYSTKFYMSTVILGTLIACTTYQGALGIFPVSILILVFCEWTQNIPRNRNIKFVMSSGIGYLLAMLIYKVYIMKPVRSYVSSEMYSLTELPQGVISNIKKYLTLVYTDFDIKWLLLLAILFFAFIIISVLHTQKNRFFTALFAIVTVFFSVCLCWGPYIAMKTPTFYCRGMYGFGTLIAIYGVICVNSKNKFSKKQYIFKITSWGGKIACISLCWCFFVFSFVYANALNEQQRYRDFRTEIILNALDQVLVSNSETPVNLQIIGSTGISPIVERMPQYDGVLNRLVYNSFDESFWGIYNFQHYYDLQFNKVDNLQDLNLPVLYDGYYQTVYGDENNILIKIKSY